MHIDRITTAITHMDKMVSFYNAVFQAGLEPFGPAMDMPFHRGKLDGKMLIFCPNSIAGVDAQQSRQQFHFVVDDLDAVLQQALNSGGQLHSPVEQNRNSKSAAVVDPDGNTMEFIQYTT